MDTEITVGSKTWVDSREENFEYCWIWVKLGLENEYEDLTRLRFSILGKLFSNARKLRKISANKLLYFTQRRRLKRITNRKHNEAKLTTALFGELNAATKITKTTVHRLFIWYWYLFLHALLYIRVSNTIHCSKLWPH